MKKVLVLLVISMMGLWAFVGFAYAEKMEVIAHHYWPGGGDRISIDKIFDLFEEMHPEIKLTRVTTEHEAYKTLIKIVTTGKKPPDVFTEHQGFRARALMEHMADITDLWEEKGYDEYFPNWRQVLIESNGGLFGVPLSGAGWTGIWYNKKIFANLGLYPPRSWDGFLKVCGKVKGADIIPISLGAQFKWPTYAWFEYLVFRTAGLNFYQGLLSGKESYTDPRVVRVFKIWKELIDKGYLDPTAGSYSWAEGIAKVARGEATMNLMGNWAHGQLKTALKMKPGVDYDYFRFPMIDAGVPIVTDFITEGFFMHKRAPHPEGARIFLDFTASAKAQQVFNKYKGQLAVNVKADMGDIYDPISARFDEEVKTSLLAVSYDLGQPAEMANYGLDRFVEFLTFPGKYMEILEKLEEKATEFFRK